MPVPDPRVDAYIARSAPFAQSLLHWLRAQVHAACPGIEESIRWGMPAFLHGGRLFASMAAFKRHASFGFHGAGAGVVKDAPRGAGMGHLGRLTCEQDLPPSDDFRAQLLQARELADAPTPRPRAAPRPAPVAPPDFLEALGGNARARATFEAFAPSHRREYVDWILEARRAQTRQRRIAQALEWLAEGKPRNWRYMKPGSLPDAGKTG